MQETTIIHDESIRTFYTYVPSEVTKGMTLVVGLHGYTCLLYTSPSPRDVEESRMPSSA